jgi:hypothetical protein
VDLNKIDFSPDAAILIMPIASSATINDMTTVFNSSRIPTAN